MTKRVPGQGASSGSVHNALIDAYFDLIEQGFDPSKVTARMITGRAGVSSSAINYHFASMDDFVACAGKQAYDRINLGRLELLQAAVQRNWPEPPGLEDVIGALVRPTLPGRDSDMRVLLHIGQLLARGRKSTALSILDQEMVPHQLVIDTLSDLAPWLSRAEVGWRVNGILGIRTQVLQRLARTRLLTIGALDLDDSEAVVSAIVDLAVPMFAPPDRIALPRHRF